MLDRIYDAIKTNDKILAEMLENSNGDETREDIQNPDNWEIHAWDTTDDFDYFEELKESFEDIGTLYAYTLYRPDRWEGQLMAYFFDNGIFELHWGPQGKY